MTIEIDMNINHRLPDGIDIRLHLPDGGQASVAALLSQLQGQLVTILGGKIANVGDSLNSAVDRINASNAATNQQIADLQAKVAELEATIMDVPKVMEALGTLENRADSIDQSNSQSPSQ